MEPIVFKIYRSVPDVDTLYIDTVPEKDWKQTKFVSGGMSTPSDAKRAKLRAKRKNTK
jgi:hypothetical protein